MRSDGRRDAFAIGDDLDALAVLMKATAQRAGSVATLTRRDCKNCGPSTLFNGYRCIHCNSVAPGMDEAMLRTAEAEAAVRWRRIEAVPASRRKASPARKSLENKAKSSDSGRLSGGRSAQNR